MACFTSMPIRSVIVIALLGWGFTACVARNVRPPPRLEVKVGGSSATWHDYREGGACDADPAVLQGELEGTNRLLATFLGSTSAGLEGVWAAEHLMQLEDGEKALAPMLDALEATYKVLPSCRFDNADALAQETRRGRELTRQTRRRLEEGPYLRSYVAFRLELSGFKAAQVARREAAQQEACKGKKRRKKEALKPFFAAEDEKGVQTFEFCDGATVQRSIGGSPAVTLPLKKARKGKAPLAADYLGAITAFAPEQIERAPRPPRRFESNAKSDEPAPTGFADEFR